MAAAIPRRRWKEGPRSDEEGDEQPEQSKASGKTSRDQGSLDEISNCLLLSPNGMKVPQTAGRKFSVRGMVQSKTIRKRARLRLSLKRGFRARLSSPVAARDNSVRDCTALEARSSSVKAQQPVSNPVSFQSPIRAKEAPDASQSIVGAALAEAEKTPFEFGKSEMKKETAPVLSSAAPLASGLTLPIGIPSYGSTSTPVFSASGFSVGSGGTVVSASSSQRRKGRRKR